MGAKKRLRDLLEAVEQFTVVAAVYDQKVDVKSDDLTISVGHFFETGGSFGPEFSAQVKYALGDWRRLNKAVRKARKTLRKSEP